MDYFKALEKKSQYSTSKSNKTMIKLGMWPTRFSVIAFSNELFHSFHFIDKISSQSYNNVQNIKKGYKSANEIFRGS